MYYLDVRGITMPAAIGAAPHITMRGMSCCYRCKYTYLGSIYKEPAYLYREPRRVTLSVLAGYS